jgi:molecular chaperone DnaJ
VDDYYAVLGVSAGASDAEIRGAFRRLARQHHPDVNPDPAAPERFRAVVAAYEVLSDPARRTTYDARRRDRGGVGGVGGTAAGAGTGGRRTAGTGTGAGASVGRGTGTGTGVDAAERWSMPPVRGLDRHSTVRVPARVLERGGVATLDHRRWEPCARCGGFGRLREPVPCQACGGSGFIEGRLSDPCKVCWTSGTTTVCPDCTGRGSLWRAKHFEITVPAGSRYGQQLRLRGMGDAGPRNGPPGDLYVHLAPPLPAAVEAVASSEFVQEVLRRLDEWLDRFAPYPAGQG